LKESASSTISSNILSEITRRIGLVSNLNLEENNTYQEFLGCVCTRMRIDVTTLLYHIPVSETPYAKSPLKVAD
jgi:hypothetical protein